MVYKLDNVAVTYLDEINTASALSEASSRTVDPARRKKCVARAAGYPLIVSNKDPGHDGS